MDKRQESMDFIDKLADKLGDIADNIHWDELSNLVADVCTEAGETTGYEKLVDPCQFLYRLYHRVKPFTEPQEFNVVYESDRLEKGERARYIRIVNYDYKTYIWAKKNGLDERLNNNFMDIDESKLSPKQIEHFLEKSKKSL